MIRVTRFTLSTTTNKLLFIIINFCVLIHFIGCTFINPEIVRFAQRRCQNESTNSPLLRGFWQLWEFPNDKQTHCYIKCFLYKMGLINIYTRELNGPVIIEQLKEHGFNISEKEQLVLFGASDGTCKSYYNKWMSAKNVLGIKLRIALYAFHADSTVYFSEYANSKSIKQTASTFCITLAVKNVKNSNIPLLTSKFNRDFSKAFQCHLECIYRYFHYFDGYGRIDPKEIILSIMEAKQLRFVQTNSAKHEQSSGQENIKSKVEKCSHRANLYYNEGSCKTAYILHQCLIDNIVNYGLIFKYRDQITYYY